MDTTIKARLLERLRSGEVVQGHDRLGTPDGQRCCLGVLCDIAVEEGVIPPPQPDGDNQCLYYGDPGDENMHVLPQRVKMWAGLDNNNPTIETEDWGVYSLAELNDGSSADSGGERPPLTFAQIADAIEESGL